MKLQKKSYINYSGKVYDLGVTQKNKNYVANNISVHNSAAGSLISYLFGIINTHPLKFNLLFERFLTKGRLGHFEKKKMYEVTLEDGTKKVLPINITTKALKVGDDILV